MERLKAELAGAQRPELLMLLVGAITELTVRGRLYYDRADLPGRLPRTVVNLYIDRKVPTLFFTSSVSVGATSIPDRRAHTMRRGLSSSASPTTPGASAASPMARMIPPAQSPARQRAASPATSSSPMSAPCI